MYVLSISGPSQLGSLECDVLCAVMESLTRVIPLYGTHGREFKT